jgi:TP901 family phage tail tape measure protein
MADALGKVGQASQQAFHDPARGLRQLTVDFNTFVRIVSTQAIIRAFRQISDAMTDGIRNATEFQTKVAQIFTISNGFSQGNISAEVRKISDAFNIPLVDSANALYQTFSNQVGNTAESLHFFSEAAKFSKGSVSTMKDSVDLLSGAMNSFQLNADQTGNVAGKFFKAIELGRLTATDLANTFGRVGPKAAELGISLEQVLAGLATITQAGVRPSEAITQLQGVMQAFLKPTKAMQEALERLGFSSANQVFASHNLAEAIQLVRSTTDGTQEAFNKLFPNIRGVNGALLIGGRSAGIFAGALKDINEASSKLNDEKAQIVLGSDAQKAERELNKLTNFLTVDFGQAILKNVALFAQWTGGVDAMIAAGRSLTPVILAAGTSVALFGAQVGWAAVRANLGGKAFSGLATGLLAIGAAAAAGNVIGNFINDKIFGPINERERQLQSDLKAFKDASAKKVEDSDKANEAIIQRASQRFAKLGVIYNQDVENAKKAMSLLEDGYKRSFDKILGARERLTEELRRQEEHARQAQIDSRDRIIDIVNKTEDRSFNRRLRGVSDLEKIFRLNRRAAETASKAQQDLLANPGDPKAIQRALQLFDKAQNLGEQSEEIGRRIGNRTAEFQAAKLLNDISKQQIEAELRLTQIQKERQQALAAEREKQEQIVEAMKQSVKTILDNTGDFDKEGKLFDKETIAKRDKARQQATSDLVKNALSQKDLKALDVLGLAKFVNEFRTELTTKPTEVTLDFERSLGRLRGDLARAGENFGKSIPEKQGLEIALGKQFSNPQELSAGLQEARTKASELTQQFERAAASSKEIRDRGVELGKALADVDGRAKESLIFGGGFRHPLKSTRDDIDEAKRLLQSGARNPDVADKDIERIERVLANLKAQKSFTNSDLNVDTGKLEIALEILKRIKAARDDLKQNPAAINEQGSQAQLQQLQNAIQTLDPATPLKNAVEQLKAASLEASVSFSAAQTQAGATASAVAQIATNWERAAIAAERAARASAGGGGQQAFLGGLIHPRYFALGGPVGADRVPAWLSPGEMVMNRGATSRFFSQLSAMNAGARGGRLPVSNTTVGDTTFNISVNESRTPNQTGRAVAAEIRREQRRGSVRRF